MPRSAFRCTALSRYVSAMYFARSGSPGRRHASAYSPGSARTWIGIARNPNVPRPNGTIHCGGGARRPAARPDPRLLRGGADRARVPRGHRAPQARPFQRGRRGRAADGALPRRRERRPDGRRLRGVRRTRGRRGSAHGDRRGAGRRRPVGGGPRDDAVPPRRPAGPARVRARRAARAGRDRAAARRGPRLRPAPAGLRSRAPRGDRDRPAEARPGRLPLAHAGADRRGALVALGSGRRDPLQGRGLGVDALGGAAPAGLGRSRRAQPRLREARPARPLPLPAHACSRRLPLRAPGERAGDPGLRRHRHAEDDLLPQLGVLRYKPGLVRRLVSLVVLACICAPAAHAGRGLLVGVDDDGLKWEPADAFLAPVHDLGGGAVRITFVWRPGRTRPSSSDAAELVNVATAAATTRVVVEVGGGRPSVPPRTRRQRGQYCAYVAGMLRAAPGVRDVAIWTEANQPRFWRHPDAGAYVALLARCYDVLHRARPDVNVIASVGPHKRIRGAIGPVQWYAQLGAAYRASGRRRPIFDTVGHNAYPDSPFEPPWTVHRGGPSIDEGDYARLMRVLSRAFGR